MMVNGVCYVQLHLWLVIFKEGFMSKNKAMDRLLVNKIVKTGEYIRPDDVVRDTDIDYNFIYQFTRGYTSGNWNQDKVKELANYFEIPVEEMKQIIREEVKGDERI